MSVDQYSQNIILSGGEFEAERKYWEEKLQGEVSICALPGDFGSRGISHEGGYQQSVFPFDLDGEIQERIRALSKNSPYGAFMIVVAAVNYLLYRYTGKEDIIVAAPVFKSKEAALSLNSIVLLRNSASENLTFKDFLLEVRRTVTEADEYSNYPFEKIAEFCRLEKAPDGTPAVKTMVLLEQIHDREGLRNTPVDLIFSFSLTEKSLELRLEYNAHFYSRELMAGLAGHLANILGAVTLNPNLPLSEIEMLAPEEARRLVEEFNGHSADYPREKTLHRLFEEQTARTPDRIAVTFQETNLTYRELNEKSNQLARRLQRIGVKPVVMVGIMLERSPEMIIGLLGILKAGGAYLPLDPDYPRERINYMLEDSDTQVLLVDSLQFTVDSKKPRTIINLKDDTIYRGGRGKS